MKTAHKIVRLSSHRQGQMDFLLQRIQRLEDHLKKEPFSSVIIVPVEDGSSFISHDQIIRCEASSNYCTLFLRDNKKVCLSKPLKWVNERLPVNLFLRVHCSHLINLNFIAKIIKGQNAFLELIDGKRIPISRSKRSDIDNMIPFSF